MPIWSNDIEVILEGIRQNCIIMTEEHKKRYINLKSQLRYFKVPIIILSAINSVTAIGLQPYIAQQNISVLTCLLALSCGIVGSVELYLGINTNMEKELTSSKDFYLLSVELYKVLALKPEHRSIDGNDFLNEKYKEYIQLITDSNIVVKTISDRLASLPKENKEQQLLDCLPKEPILINNIELNNVELNNVSTIVNNNEHTI